jgi:hypothetical protein
MDDIKTKYEEMLRKFNNLLIDYFDSRSLLYLAAGVFLLENVNTQIASVFGGIFVVCSLLLLPAQLFSTCRIWAQHIDTMFRTGETIITVGMLFLGSLLPAPKQDFILPSFLIVLCWFILWALVKSWQIAKAIGVFRTIVFIVSVGSIFTLCMGTTNIWIHRLSIAGAIIGLALLPSMLSFWFFSKDR